MARRDRLLQNVAHAGGRGLEIGPLMAPTLTRDIADIYFLDHASTEELREKYRHDPAVSEDLITEVDFVWGDQTMVEATKSAAPFDYVIAAHVLEHVPDMSGWLREISSVLRPGGRLSLCMPDRRFTFDVRRHPSDISELVEAALLGLRRPAVRSTFDHFYRHVEVDTVALWHGMNGHSNPPLDGKTALELSHLSATTGTYVDTHCWVFSDVEFLRLLRLATEMGLVELKVVAFVPTEPNELEFFVTLERLPDDMPAEQRKAECLKALADALSQPVPGIPIGNPSTGQIGSDMRVSDLERRLIEIKRRALTRARSAVASLRR